MTTKQIRIGEDCINILKKWQEDPEHESYSDAIRRMGRYLKLYRSEPECQHQKIQ